MTAEPYATSDVQDFPSFTDVVTLHPGDKVIFRFDDHLTQQDAQDISDIIAAKLGPEFSFLVVGKGVDLTVYRSA